MKLLIHLSSKYRDSLDLALKDLKALAEKKGLSPKIDRKMTLKKRIPNSEYELRKYRACLILKNPSESFITEMTSLRLSEEIRGLVEVRK